ncbi:hypothetical protein ABH945_004797 [Paraburkholderia sp. GAS333]
MDDVTAIFVVASVVVTLLLLAGITGVAISRDVTTRRPILI